jgi:tetratricopeptide (TPR) repeat protein
MEMNVSKSLVRMELGKRWKEQAVELALLGRWDEAVQMNLRILGLFPEDIGAQNRLGKAYRELGRLEEAATTYEESLKRQPSNPIARKNLTELYTELKRDPEALAGMMDSEDDEDDSQDDAEDEPEDDGD